MIGIGRWCGIATLTVLAGCGGGGNVASTGAPPSSSTTTTDPVVTTPTPVAVTPAPTPTTPTPPSVNYNDTEYQWSNAAQAADAIRAYQAGFSGAGVKIAVVDTGIAPLGSEFSGRIDPASRDFGGSGSYTDTFGHGTAVSAVAAAARNGSSIEGVAWGATILALRTDNAGSCAGSDGCDFSTNTLATAIDYARTNGAKVINLSLGGGGSTPALNAAVGRATAAGIILVVAAGNDGNADPDAFARIAASADARGLVIIAGAHDAGGNLAGISNRAGGFAAYYLAALGSRVRAFDNKGDAYFYTGTSFSTPAIAGAIALLAQAFPNLSAAQLVSILYASAADAGTSGVDATYGRGLLNLARAFQPIGATSLAGSTIAVGALDASLLSSAMGDATLSTQGLGGAVVLDGYGRAFTMDVSRSARGGTSRPLVQTLGMATASSHLRAGGFDLAGTVARGVAGEPWAGLAQRGRTGRTDSATRPLEASLIGRIDGRTRIGIGWNSNAATLDDRLGGASAVARFLAARTPDDSAAPGTVRRTGVAVRHGLGAFDLSLLVEQGAMPALLRQQSQTGGYVSASARLSRAIGPIAVRLGVGTIDETRTMLGARLASAFGDAGAQTRFIDAGASAALGDGWQIAARWRAGWTHAQAGGLVSGGTLTTRAAAFDLGRAGRRTRFGLRFALPQRVTGGGLNLLLPSAYDYASGVVGYSAARLNLTPHGRERDWEAAWGAAMFGGWLDANLFWRRDPGNVATAPDDLGAALRFSLTL